MNSKHNTPNLQVKAHEGSCIETPTYKFFTECRALLPQNKGSLCVIKPAVPTTAHAKKQLAGRRQFIWYRAPFQTHIGQGRERAQGCPGFFRKAAGKAPLCLTEAGCWALHWSHLETCWGDFFLLDELGAHFWGLTMMAVIPV